MKEKLSILDLVDQDRREWSAAENKAVSAQGISFHPDEAELHSLKENMGNSFTRSRSYFTQKESSGFNGCSIDPLFREQHLRMNLLKNLVMLILDIRG